MDNTATRARDNGYLFIALYNRQGKYSDIWTLIKRTHNKSGWPIRKLISWVYHALVLTNRTISEVRHVKPIQSWYKGSERRMSLWNNTVDWVGGYPFETASPTEVIELFSKKGFKKMKLKEKKGNDCREFISQKNHHSSF